MFTIGNMFCGYACIVYAMRGEFITAAPFIGFAIVLDMLDGRIARMTNTTSAFGLEFDSLADVISFGVALGGLALIRFPEREIPPRNPWFSLEAARFIWGHPLLGRLQSLAGLGLPHGLRLHGDAFLPIVVGLASQARAARTLSSVRGTARGESDSMSSS